MNEVREFLVLPGQRGRSKLEQSSEVSPDFGDLQEITLAVGGGRKLLLYCQVTNSVGVKYGLVIGWKMSEFYLKAFGVEAVRVELVSRGRSRASSSAPLITTNKVMCKRPVFGLGRFSYTPFIPKSSGGSYPQACGSIVVSSGIKYQVGGRKWESLIIEILFIQSTNNQVNVYRRIHTHGR